MRARPRLTLSLLSVLALAAVPLAACSNDDDAASGAPTSSVPASSSTTSAPAGDDGSPGLLYVQRGGSGRTTTDGPDGVTVTLEAVDADTVWFQDRPGRDAGRLTTDDFVAEWASYGFDEDPPNATLELVDGDGGRSTHVLELGAPRWDAAARTLSYPVTPADGGGGVPPSTFGAASLFIDDAAGDVFQSIELSVSNVQPGQQVGVQVRSNDGTDVGFSSGPDLDPSAGVQVETASGVLPVTTLRVDPSTVLVETSSESGGAALEWSVSLFLVAGQGISTLSLTSTSDPGVEVTAALGDAQPQVVNSTETLFVWEE